MNDYKMNIGRILSVWFATIISWVVILSHVQAIVGIVTALSALGYTLWRWRRDFNNEKKKKNDNNLSNNSSGSVL